jgi:hypothetical protein
MIGSLLTLLVAGVVGIFALSIVLAIAGALLSITFGLIGFLLFKVAPVLLVGGIAFLTRRPAPSGCGPLSFRPKRSGVSRSARGSCRPEHATCPMEKASAWTMYGWRLKKRVYRPSSFR